jgi:hypothetical protein
MAILRISDHWKVLFILIGSVCFFVCSCADKQASPRTNPESSGTAQVLKAQDEIEPSIMSFLLEQKNAYDMAKSDTERRLICLRLIDEGVIAPGLPISHLDIVFGTRFSDDLPKKSGSLSFREVYFSPQPKHEDLLLSTSPVGWYLFVKYNWLGKIENYYLSNINK